MNFPIPVNMTVDSGEAIQMTVQGDVTVSCVVDLRISPNVQETYDGPYSVTPSESVQTLETADKSMTDDVTVGAIPSDYVGSSVPRKTSSDLTASGPTVTVPAGYYDEQATKSVGNGTVKLMLEVSADPSISVDGNGLVTAETSSNSYQYPIESDGYVRTFYAVPLKVSGSKTLQIPATTYKDNIVIGIEPDIFITQDGLVGVSKDEVSTLYPVASGGFAKTTDPFLVGVWAHNSLQLETQAGTTITPTESEQTAVAAQKFTTGEVKVGAIPSNYVGSSVPTQAAQTITPTTADQTIASGKYLTGAQTIKGDANLMPENIKKDVTIFNVVGSYEGSLTEDTLLKALRNQTTYVEDDTLTSIRSYGLAYCTALISVSFHELQTISSYAFYNDYSLIMNGWPFPKAKTIGNYAFRYCYGLTGDIVLPSTVTSIGQYSFANCDHMETFTAAGAISTLGTYTFIGASGHVMALREIHMPNLGTGIALNLNFGSTTAANACQHLEICDIGKAKSIAANTFANCYKLQTLIMRRTSVTTCANVSAFLNTPLRGRSGLTAKIYVPEALIDSYKAASVWSTINGYGYVEWCKIEGSQYEL